MLFGLFCRGKEIPEQPTLFTWMLHFQWEKHLITNPTDNFSHLTFKNEEIQQSSVTWMAEKVIYPIKKKAATR